MKFLDRQLAQNGYQRLHVEIPTINWPYPNATCAASDKHPVSLQRMLKHINERTYQLTNRYPLGDKFLTENYLNLKPNVRDDDRPYYRWQAILHAYVKG